VLGKASWALHSSSKYVFWKVFNKVNLHNSISKTAIQVLFTSQVFMMILCGGG
jgi:long-subunit fatty acid transport protein